MKKTKLKKGDVVVFECESEFAIGVIYIHKNKKLYIDTGGWNIYLSYAELMYYITYIGKL